MTREEKNELGNIQRSIGNMEGDIRQILKMQDKITEVQDGHGRSITSLHNRQHWYNGGFGVIAFGIVFFRDSINKIFG